MSADNVDVAKRLYAAWNDRDLEAMRALLHDEPVFVNPADAVEPGTRVGLEAVEQVLQAQWAALEDSRQDIERIEARGDLVFVLAKMSARLPGSDAWVTQQFAGVLTIKEGRATRLALFSDLDEAERVFSG